MSRNICVSLTERCHVGSVMCQALPVHQERRKIKYIQVSAAISGHVMLQRRGQARPVQSKREERSDCRAGTEFQASHCSWNFKNFERSDLSSETSNLMNSLRISGRIWEFSSYFKGIELTSIPCLFCFMLAFSCPECVSEENTYELYCGFQKKFRIYIKERNLGISYTISHLPCAVSLHMQY